MGASPARFSPPSKRKRARHLGRQVRFAPPRREKLGAGSQPVALRHALGGTFWSTDRRFFQFGPPMVAPTPVRGVFWSTDRRFFQFGPPIVVPMPVRGVFWSTLRRFFQFGWPMVAPTPVRGVVWSTGWPFFQFGRPMVAPMSVRGAFWSTLRRFFQFGPPMVVGLTRTVPSRGTRLGRFLAFPPPIRSSRDATLEVFVPAPPFSCISFISRSPSDCGPFYPMCWPNFEESS